MTSQDFAAHPEEESNPKAAHGLAQMRAGTTTALNGVLTTMATDGLGDDWRRARMPALMAIAPEAAALLEPEQKASIARTAMAVAGAMSAADLKTSLTRFAGAVAGAAPPAPS
jgi:hypothetical protein